MAHLKSEKSGLATLSKWLLPGLVILVVLVLLWVSHYQQPDLLNFFRDREAVTVYLAQLGWWGPLLYLLIVHLQVLTATIPGHALMLGAAYLYGFPLGLLLNTLGGVGASQVAFALARRMGQPWVKRRLPEAILRRWQPVVEQRGFFFFLICFWLPIVPHNATNYLAGLSSISAWHFFWANLLGRLPGMIIISLIGAYGLEFSWAQWVLLAAIGLVFLLTGRFLAPKIRRRFC
jgi:uncharacterized membrane protein YdjX (TVP38/TMEM64 family)